MKQPHFNSFAILIVPRISKKSKDQLLLSVRITINSGRAEFRIPRTVQAKLWDHEERPKATPLKLVDSIYFSMK